MPTRGISGLLKEFAGPLIEYVNGNNKSKLLNLENIVYVVVQAFNRDHKGVIKIDI